MKRFGPGWFRESYRHSLAARGILTSKFRRSYAGLDPNDKRWMSDLQSGVIDEKLFSEENGDVRFEIRRAIRRGDADGIYRMIAKGDWNADDWKLALQYFPEVIDILPEEFDKNDFKEAWIKGVGSRPDFFDKYISVYGFNENDPVVREFLASPAGIGFAAQMKKKGVLSRFDQEAWEDIVKRNPRLAAYSPYATQEELIEAVKLDPTLITSPSAGLRGKDNYAALVNAAIDSDPALISEPDLQEYVSTDRWLRALNEDPTLAEYYRGEDPDVINRVVQISPGLITRFREVPEHAWEEVLANPGVEIDANRIPEKYYDQFIRSQERSIDPQGFSDRDASLMRIHNQDLFNLAYYVNASGGKVTKQDVERIAAELKNKNPEGWRPLTNKRAVVDFLNEQRGPITVADIMRFDKEHPEYYADSTAHHLIGSMHESGVTPTEMRGVVPELLDPFGHFNAKSDVSYGFSTYSGGQRINPRPNPTFQLNWKKDKIDKLLNVLVKAGADENTAERALRNGMREHNRAHPVSIKGDVTLAMMRLYPMKDSVYVEEVQSDIEGAGIPTLDFEDAAFRMLQKEIMSKAPNVKRIIFPGSDFKNLVYGNRGLTFYDRIADKNKMRQLPVAEKMEFFKQLERDNPKVFSLDRLQRNLQEESNRGFSKSVKSTKIEEIPIYYKDVDAARRGLYASKVIK